MNKNKINQIANYLEELSWLVESNKNFSFREISNILRDLSYERNNAFHLNASKFNDQTGKTFLVGILPNVLQDTELFKSNNDMLEFAEQILQLKPSRAAKRSRTEYIGWIVCEVSNTESERLDDLYKHLRFLFSDTNNVKKIKEAKKSTDFSWNDIISNL
ncbi:hypothetical protein [Epilithonimonas sp.]|uniref:hypothetical protein n=1 Tax=Epilithonimonas sp. TaxID=2894511 RepID=UPI002898F60B|nr:hypothetical protein [Epilithonimonas sp.]